MRRLLRFLHIFILCCLRKTEFGCHYAVVEIDVPKNLSEDAKQKLAEFDRAASACGAGGAAGAGGSGQADGSSRPGHSGHGGRAA